MDVHAFRGQGRIFGFTADKAGSNLPPEYGPWVFFRSLSMTRGEEPGAAVRTDECLDDIDNYGFHVTDAHVRITENVVKQQ